MTRPYRGRDVIAGGVVLMACMAGCGQAYWRGVRVTAVTRQGDGDAAVPGAQVRLLQPSVDMCGAPNRTDAEHWFERWGLRTDREGQARFQMWKCDRVRAVVSKVGFEPALAEVDSCEARPSRYAPVTVELRPRPEPPAARGAGITATAFVTALAHGRWNDALALTGAANGDLEAAPPIVQSLRRTYEADSLSTVAEQVSVSERRADATVCVRLVHADGCVVPFEVTLARAGDTWTVTSLAAIRCDSRPG